MTGRDPDKQEKKRKRPSSRTLFLTPRGPRRVLEAEEEKQSCTDGTATLRCRDSAELKNGCDTCGKGETSRSDSAGHLDLSYQVIYLAAAAAGQSPEKRGEGSVPLLEEEERKGKGGSRNGSPVLNISPTSSILLTSPPPSSFPFSLFCGGYHRAHTTSSSSRSCQEERRKASPPSFFYDQPFFPQSQYW